MAVPDALGADHAASIRAWLLAIDSLDRDALVTHEIPSTIPGVFIATTYLSPAELPPEVNLSEADRRAVESPDFWLTLSAAERDLLILRLAVDFVRTDYGGCVPEGLVARTVSMARMAQL